MALSLVGKLYPELCSAAFVLKCRVGRGRLVGAFAKSYFENAYRSELMGLMLMAVHIILLAVNKIKPTLKG